MIINTGTDHKSLTFKAFPDRLPLEGNNSGSREILAYIGIHLFNPNAILASHGENILLDFRLQCI